MKKILWLTLAIALGAGTAHAERPSFRNVETKLTGFASSSLNDDSDYAGALSGSTVFRNHFFVSGSAGFGSSTFTNSSSLALGMLKNVGEDSIVFASVGARRYAEFKPRFSFDTESDRETFDTATASVGIRSMLTSRFEGEAGITALENGPYGLQVGLKGTYYFTESIGGVMELGSSDGDGTGGIGLRFNF